MAPVRAECTRALPEDVQLDKQLTDCNGGELQEYDGEQVKDGEKGMTE